MSKPLTKILFSFLFAFSVASIAQAEATPAAQKEWTFLLFLNGHNNLDSFGAFNINQMEEVGSNDQINMVVQWASLKNKQTKRLYVTRDQDTDNVTSKAIETMDPVDMGDYNQLIEFVRWGVQKYPAKRYMIAVWNHGNGWHLTKNGQMNARDISYDDLTDNKITTEQLGIAMAKAAEIIGHKVDIYGSDACLMAMAEVAAEMKDSVQYFVGSQETEPGFGWPYSTWMKRWVNDSTPTAAEVSTYLTQEYKKAYSGGIYGNQDVTLSAWRMDKFEAFETAMKSFNTALTNLSPTELNLAKDVVLETQEFYSSDYKDIYDFAMKLGMARTGVDVGILSGVKEAVSALVIDNQASAYYTGAFGVSVWMPIHAWELNEHKARYENLKFNQATGWLNFLSSLNPQKVPGRF